MRHSELITCLQNLMGFVPPSVTIAEILGLPVRTVYSRTQRDSSYSIEEIRAIERYYSVDLSERKNFIPVQYFSQIDGTVTGKKFVLNETNESLYIDISLYGDTSKSDGNYFIFKAFGDVMSPYIIDNDFLVAEKCDDLKQIKDNDIYLFSYKNVIYLRRISKDIDGLIVKVDNSLYDSKNIKETEMKNLYLIGHVIGLFRNLR